MAELVILGTAASIPDEEHENTHMAMVDDESTILIDCVSSPAVRMAKAGLHFAQVDDLILTHFHPDHVSGVPLLLMNMWLLGRKSALRIYGLHHCLKRVEDMMGFYHWENWPNFFPVAFHRLPESEGILVLESADVRILSSPVRHLIPTIGLRWEAEDGRAVAYSCDTEPSPAVVRLAEGADILFHEASGATVGHSSARQAGEVARQAGVDQLYLIHYSTADLDGDALIAEASEVFSGEVALAKDFMRVRLS